MANVKKLEVIQPNRVLDSTHIRDLVESLGATDLARPVVVVRPTADREEYAWAVIAGFHRIEAAKPSGRKQRGV
jgi:ParB-like chromosome segregation protein Spo0J